jgi:DNA polymerase
MGADEAIGDEPIDRFNLPKEVAKPAAAKSPSEAASSKANLAPSKLPPPNLSRAEPLHQASLEDTIIAAKALAAGANDLAALKEALKNFDACPLKRTAANTLFGFGKADADLMIIGEIPDSNEDKQGVPFAGENGQMLSKMMQAIGFEGGMEDIYSTTALPWRPPGNRKPTPLELGSCLPFLQRHIELVKPKCLLIMGGTALRELTGSNDRIKKTRGKWLEITIGDSIIPTMVTYHPTYLTKQRACKKETWADLLLVKKMLHGEKLNG